MGKPKTGIGAIDNAESNVKGAVSDVSNGVNNVASQVSNGINNAGAQAANGVNNFLDQASNISNVTDAIRDTVAGLSKNVERNVANNFNSVGLAIKGDFTGFDRTLIDMYTHLMPMGLMTNPDDVNNWTGTTTAEQQLTKKAEDAAAQTAADEVAKARESAMNDIAGVISGQIGARRRGPGRDLTLLGGGYTPGSYTLLTGV